MWLKPLYMAVQSLQKPCVLGCGALAVDYIALVQKFPKPDSKIRTEHLDILGGGNVGNTLTCLARLGIETLALSKIGKDGNGQIITDGLRSEGIDISRVISTSRTASPFTYIIVDKTNASRTCIHTPLTEELLLDEISLDVLDGISIVHFDSRMTKAAVKLAKMARLKNIPIVIDAEKDRPYFSELLPFADFLVTNSGFPQLYTGAPSRLEGIRELFKITAAKFIICTVGSEGSILAHRGDCPWMGFFDNCSNLYSSITIKKEQVHDMTVMYCSACAVSLDEIVDTTGAGDAFIGAIIYGILHELSAEKMLALGSYISAQKIKKLGARDGIPTIEELRGTVPTLLER